MGWTKRLTPCVLRDNKHVGRSLGFGDDSVSVYERNATTGELSFKSLLKDGVNGVNGLDGPRNIVLSADGEFALSPVGRMIRLVGMIETLPRELYPIWEF